MDTVVRPDRTPRLMERIVAATRGAAHLPLRGTGKEVSRFVARHFEAVLKGSTSWNKGDLERALEEAFMELDVRIASEQGLKELEQIANDGRRGTCVDLLTI